MLSKMTNNNLPRKALITWKKSKYNSKVYLYSFSTTSKLLEEIIWANYINDVRNILNLNYSSLHNVITSVANQNI